MRKNPGSGTIPAGVMLEIYRNYRRSGGKKRLKDFPEVRRKLKRALKKKDLLRQAEGKTIAQLVRTRQKKIWNGCRNIKKRTICCLPQGDSCGFFLKRT